MGQLPIPNDPSSRPWYVHRRGGRYLLGSGSGYSDDPSSNSAVAYIFSVKFVFKNNENKQKEAGVGTFKQYRLFHKLPPQQKAIFDVNDHLLHT